MPDRDLGGALLRIARDAIGAEFGMRAEAAVSHDALERPGATFVTLTCDGDLRGCIGSLEAHRLLRRDVHENAVAAAFRDPRFPPLTSVEFGVMSIEVSLLSPCERLRATDEQQLLAQLRPGVDGLTIECDQRRATFLPQVWESFAEPRQFVAALKRKAGLRADFWGPQLCVSRYTVTRWKESEIRCVPAGR